MQMIPIIERSVKVLVEVVGDAADTGRSVDMCKTFTLFSMETILATAFGRVIDVQREEADVMTEAAANFFEKFNGNMSLGLFLFSK